MQNLFAEGNDLFREKDYKQALVQYMEGLNVADYAASDQVALPQELLCKLHVNRAACYFTMVSLVSSLPLLRRPRPITASPRCPAKPGPCPVSLCRAGSSTSSCLNLTIHSHGSQPQLHNRLTWRVFKAIICNKKIF